MLLYSCTLPFPPSVNGCFGGGSGQRRFKTQAYKLWEVEAALGVIKSQTIAQAVMVGYDFYFPDKRTRDIGNYEKVPTDFLVRCGVLKDDNSSIVQRIDLRYAGIDRDNPRVEVEIRTL